MEYRLGVVPGGLPHPVGGPGSGGRRSCRTGLAGARAGACDPGHICGGGRRSDLAVLRTDLWRRHRLGRAAKPGPGAVALRRSRRVMSEPGADRSRLGRLFDVRLEGYGGTVNEAARPAPCVRGRRRRHLAGGAVSDVPAVVVPRVVRPSRRALVVPSAEGEMTEGSRRPPDQGRLTKSLSS